MGHISPDTARKLVKDKMVTGIRLEYMPFGRPFFCASCVYAKATRKLVPKMREGERAEEFGGEVHSDVWGPAPVESRGGRKYYVTFINDKSQLTTLYLLKTKDEVPWAYKQYETWVETQMGKKVKVLNSDRGGEYQGTNFVEYLKSKGTVQKLNVHDTPQHAGVAKRRNRMIGECIRALLHASGLPKFLWGEAARHVVWLLNRTTTKAVEGMMPFEAGFGKKPDLKCVREWGEKVYVRVEGGTKLGGRVREGRWIGIDLESKGARVYWPDNKKVNVERNIYFNEAAVNHLEDENEQIVLTKTFPTVINAPVNPTPIIPEVTAEDSETDTSSKRTRKSSQKVADLLGGRGTWATNKAGQSLAPGIQNPVMIGQRLSWNARMIMHLWQKLRRQKHWNPVVSRKPKFVLIGHYGRKLLRRS